jgi:hypothetical protein
MANDTIALLLRQVRSGTIQLLQHFPEKYLRWAPPKTTNHALWHAGHALWLLDQLGVELITGHSELPAGWAQTFGMNCRRPSETTAWPSRDEVSTRLGNQYGRMKDLLIGSSQPDLWAGESSSCIGGRIIHALHDEARHQGEMYLLYKLAAGQTPPRSPP